MKRIVSFLCFFILCISSAFSEKPIQTDRIIVKFKSEPKNGFDASRVLTGNNKIDSINSIFDAKSIHKIKPGKKLQNDIYIIKFDEKADLKKIIEEYYKTNEIEYAEPDFIGSGGGQMGIIPNDQFYFRQWSLNNDGTFQYSPAVAGADIDMEKAWEIEQGDENIIVAIMDSGLRINHPEFSGRIWENSNETAANYKDDDNNGYIDDVRGWDFANNDNNPTDDHGHGTNVTGILGATGNNSIGYAGVDWKCKLMILKGLNAENLGYYSWWTEAIYYAVNNGARAINMSVGGSGYSVTLHNAINYAIEKNVVVVACMMNTNSSVIYYPAGFSGVIAVGSTDPNDNRSNPFFWSQTSGSNFGQHISVVAPGNYIFGLHHTSDTEYGYYWGGTSQATPHVTGLVSLLLAQDPERTLEQIRSIIESTAEDQVGNPAEDVAGWDMYFGHGRINAYKALSSSTNINPQYYNEMFRIYPNPSSGLFTLDFPYGVEQIHIFNSVGQSILNENVKGQKTKSINILGNGVYFVTFTTNTGVVTRKVIIQK